MPPESSDASEGEVQYAALRQALAHVRSSDDFRRTKRLASLLEHLVMKVAQARTGDLSEHAIATEFFRRDAASYDPGDDPIVRVHVSRLRARLSTYYSGSGKGAALHIALPPGRYVPELRWSVPQPRHPRHTMLLLPAQIFAPRRAKRYLALSTIEELKHQLFERFGSALACPTKQCGGGRSGGATAPERRVLVDSSVRIDRDSMRIGVRLIEASDISVIWSRQFDQSASAGIPEQQRTAAMIASEVHSYLAASRTFT